jgi:dATP pyrophosphohydrolase
MPRAVTDLIDVYPYRLAGMGREYLLLRRSPDVVYAGEWRMVGGKIRRGETAGQAAVRELREETGLSPRVFWTVPSVNIFYERESDVVHLIPAFAAELTADPLLNHEHDDFGWYAYDAAVKRLRWPEQRRLLGIVDAELDREIPVSWRVT